MGYNPWDNDKFKKYTYKTKAMSVDSRGSIVGDMTVQNTFTSRKIHDDLFLDGKIRESRDSEEHPCSLPVIIGLDVTGSMGRSAIEVARKLGVLMSKLLENVKDVQIMIMGIGDLSYDKYPVQVSQFESDIRIAEHLDKVFFESGGGGNSYESYTAAWYVGAYHTSIDSYEKRGRKGIIITLGDEMINPYLPLGRLYSALGINADSGIQHANTETDELYKVVSEKYNVYHISISDTNAYQMYKDRIERSFRKYIGDNYRIASVEESMDVIYDIIANEAKAQNDDAIKFDILGTEPEEDTSSFDMGTDISW